jgi:hypothetical protein
MNIRTNKPIRFGIKAAAGLLLVIGLTTPSLAPNESPIIKERIEYLKSKPYKDTTINVMALRSAVGDCLEYHAPRWEEETGAHVNVTKVPDRYVAPTDFRRPDKRLGPV